MKLKCDKHGRRVTSGANSWLHLAGDGSKCDSVLASIGTQAFAFNGRSFISVSNSVKNGRQTPTLRFHEVPCPVNKTHNADRDSYSGTVYCDSCSFMSVV